MPTGRYNLEQIAAVAYFANKGLRLAVGNVEDAWADEHTLIRESYKAGVLYAVAFDPDPIAQHDHWRYWHRENVPGWTHPNDVDYWELRDQERDKDRLFLQVVNMLAAA